MSEGRISKGVVRAWSVLALLGGIRVLLTLFILGAAYLVMGNTAGRIIGVMFLLVLVVWVRFLIREHRADTQAKRL